MTPVYNGEAYLAECIESVLNQSYRNFEYIIVNNHSSDRTLEIAEKYAKLDSRIRIRTNDRLVPVMENHNIGLNLISPESAYCKVVCADDMIFPTCIEKLVRCGEENPGVGLVGCYQQSGNRVRWQGFPYPKAVFPGHELCRKILLGGEPEFGFGCPTSLLYRAALVRQVAEFYPNPSPHSDTSVCFRDLRNSDFGFVYEVLCYERTHEETETTRSRGLNRYVSAYLSDVIEYGPAYLDSEELERVLKRELNRYHRFLAARRLFGLEGKEFWQYHRKRLQELGYPLRGLWFPKAALRTLIREVLSPLQEIRKLRRLISSGQPN
jgi:glycosyltransferase involved in cell wall biosynthesis